MNIKIFIASIIVSLVLSAIAFVIGLANLFPAPVAFFIVALISGCLTTFWIVRPASTSTAKPKKKKASKPHKPGKPVNKGQMEIGNVKWFSANKGFGFITRESGEDIFVHFRSILGKGHRVLQDGQKVEFIVTTGDKGLQAEEVSPVS